MSSIDGKMNSHRGWFDEVNSGKYVTEHQHKRHKKDRPHLPKKVKFRWNKKRSRMEKHKTDYPEGWEW